MSSYPVTCISSDDIAIGGSFVGSGVVQGVSLQYEFKQNIIVGLNRRDIYLVYSRPVGTGSIANALVSSTSGNGYTIAPCSSGSLTINCRGFSKNLSNVHAVRVGAKITIENWVVIENITFLFFNY